MGGCAGDDAETSEAGEACVPGLSLEMLQVRALVNGDKPAWAIRTSVFPMGPPGAVVTRETSLAVDESGRLDYVTFERSGRSRCM